VRNFDRGASSPASKIAGCTPAPASSQSSTIVTTASPTSRTLTTAALPISDMALAESARSAPSLRSASPVSSVTANGSSASAKCVTRALARSRIKPPSGPNNRTARISPPGFLTNASALAPLSFIGF
jgi:hypothetical protein